jgi:hypothetical protein
MEARAPVLLSGDARRDRLAILSRAREVLLPPGRDGSSPGDVPLSQAALMGEIGVELLALDPAKGAEAVERAIEMATGAPERVTPVATDAPERSRTGVLARLAQSLKGHPELAAKVARAAHEGTRGIAHTPSRIFALSLLAREVVEIDPERAREALRQARGAVYRMPDEAPADPIAAAAAATARVEGREAARLLVERAVRAIPGGPARPLVEARLAGWLAEADPARARQLARQAMEAVQGSALRAQSSDRDVLDREPNAVNREPSSTGNREPGTGNREPGTLNRLSPDPDGRLRAVAGLLAATHPEEALAAVERIRSPMERAAALVEMGRALEAPAPARAEVLFRRALSSARTLPAGPGQQQAVVAAATGLAAYDLTAARNAVMALPDGAPALDVMMLAVRAAWTEPAAARQLIRRMQNGDPASLRTIEGSHDLSLAQVTVEPDLDLALAMAQQGRSRELRAAALLSVARRLEERP